MDRFNAICYVCELASRITKLTTLEEPHATTNDERQSMNVNVSVVLVWLSMMDFDSRPPNACTTAGQMPFCMRSAAP